jgi:hypothetical protein
MAAPLSLSPSVSTSRSALLRKCAHAFCMALCSKEFNADGFVSNFFTEDAQIIEHGASNKQLPFLATFKGTQECLQYFTQLATTLLAHWPHDAFPPDDEFVVDPEAENDGTLHRGAVCVVGKGSWENKQSGWTWEEKFIYKLSGFDRDGRVARWVRVKSCFPWTELI